MTNAAAISILPTTAMGMFYFPSRNFRHSHLWGGAPSPFGPAPWPSSYQLSPMRWSLLPWNDDVFERTSPHNSAFALLDEMRAQLFPPPNQAFGRWREEGEEMQYAMRIAQGLSKDALNAEIDPSGEVLTIHANVETQTSRRSFQASLTLPFAVSDPSELKLEFNEADSVLLLRVPKASKPLPTPVPIERLESAKQQPEAVAGLPVAKTEEEKTLDKKFDAVRDAVPPPPPGASEKTQ